MSFEPRNDPPVWLGIGLILSFVLCLLGFIWFASLID